MTIIGALVSGIIMDKIGRNRVLIIGCIGAVISYVLLGLLRSQIFFWLIFFFMALLSVNLAVLNVLPIPILDGGQLMFLAIEKIKGSPLSMKARVAAQQAGLVLILALVLLVTYNDIMRFVKGF